MSDNSQSAYEQLSWKHKRFVDNYLSNGMIAWRAYQDAGYGGEDPSYEALRSAASRLLSNVNISAAISQKMAELTMKSEEVLFRLGEQGRASLFPFIKITDDGFVYFDFTHPEAKDYIHLIKKIKTKRKRLVEGRGDNAETWEHEWVEVELHDVQGALKLIGQHHKLFTQQVDVKVTEPVRIIDFSPDDED